MSTILSSYLGVKFRIVIAWGVVGAFPGFGIVTIKVFSISCENKAKKQQN